uniref:Protein ALP1-like n=1 Tax=Tanacetum cinerariifolium TaxID=118510 RepID=A0A6L2NMW2_TANCI|nr:protein ALP1-like [Tanacetum cinerariifolium]
MPKDVYGPIILMITVTGANNDINVLDNSPLFDDLLDDLAHAVPYVVNGVEYRNGYYLADGIYPEWASFVKSFTVATDSKHTYFKQRQESARKDVERAFGVLQGRWGLIQQQARAYEVNTLRRIMYAGIIMHNMILEDQNMSIVDLNHVYSNPARSMQTMWIDRCETQRLKAKELRARDTHISLQQNLMNHIWREVEEALEED